MFPCSFFLYKRKRVEEQASLRRLTSEFPYSSTQLSSCEEETFYITTRLCLVDGVAFGVFGTLGTFKVFGDLDEDDIPFFGFELSLVEDFEDDIPTSDLSLDLIHCIYLFFFLGGTIAPSLIN